MNARKLLEILLKINGAVVLLATVAVFMPRSWMAIAHERLGLGVFPEGPIVEYLARTASALYVFYGGLSWLMSRDVVRYAGVIRYMAVMSIVFGVVVAGIDHHVGMPLGWTVWESASVIVFGVVVWVLIRQVERA